jgi:hypothetical protein
MPQLRVNDNVDTSVRIDWDYPTDNGGTITEYEISILTHSVGVYSLELSSCNGADSVIVANRYCDIPMATLTAAPFLLTQGTLITA